MPNISNINGLTLCDETNVNAITIADITNIDGITKSCATCTSIALAYDAESCNNACRAEDCGEYYTDGLVDGLQVDDHIYTDEECTECADVGFYSDNPCEGVQTACFTIDEDCAITSIAECR